MNGRRRGFSLIELLIVVTIILIIAAIAIPNLMHSKIQADEAAAVETLRTLNSTSIMYSNTYGGFPHTLANMGPNGTNSPTSAGADLIDSVLATGAKAGYRFNYAILVQDPSGNVVSYTITAVPLQPGTTGQRYFYTDQSGVIRQSTTGAADSSSTPIG